jgi:hypothetical protein
MHLRRLNQAGDTIVEVLVAMTVLTFILAGAYVAANSSLTAEVRSGERSQALQLVQGQLELLRAYSSVSPISAASLQMFCLGVGVNGTYPTLNIKEYDSGVVLPSTYTPGSYPTNCNVDSAMNPIATSTGQSYSLSIVENVPTNTFTIEANWYEDSGGVGNVTVVYRAS